MKAPYFWKGGLDPRSRVAAPLTRTLLSPLAALYSLGVRRKLARAEPAIVPVPIICVGNLTVGGVGKTPIVEAIRKTLSESGLRAASLSRGYGGKEKGPLRVDPSVHSAADTGDEPLMLSASGESWIGQDRERAARVMAEEGVQVIVMDDGHQNPSVQKALSLVVIDTIDPFGNGYVLPKGPLREPVPDGLRRTDGIILVGDGPIPPQVEHTACPALRVRVVPDRTAPEGPLVAFAGIGRPEKMFDSLKVAGANLVEAVGFADHHPYSASDLRYLDKLAGDRDARLITTTKDHVRLPKTFRSKVLTFPVSAQFENPEELHILLGPIIESARR